MKEAFDLNLSEEELEEARKWSKNRLDRLNRASQFPMTAEGKIVKMLSGLGLTHDQAMEVAKLAMAEIDRDVTVSIAEGQLPPAKGPKDISEAYPGIRYVDMVVTIKKVALRWIDENAKGIWCRSLFT